MKKSIADIMGITKIVDDVLESSIINRKAIEFDTEKEVDRDAKLNFESWYTQQYIPLFRKDYLRFSRESILRKFYRSTLSMKYGVYVDFFSESNIEIWNLSTAIGEDNRFKNSIIKGSRAKEASFNNKNLLRMYSIKAASKWYNGDYDN